MSEPKDRERLENGSALVAGVLFGVGLAFAGMLDPAKVLAFLDLSRPWDPSLAVVMGGAIAVGIVAFRVAKLRSTTFLGIPLRLPTRREVDLRLILGSVGFGIGWGLSGLCPGPAVVTLAAGHPDLLFFVVAMLVGLAIGDVLDARWTKAAAKRAPDASPEGEDDLGPSAAIATRE